MIAGGLIDHGREPLRSPAIGNERAARRGGALAILALILATWITARAALWESPFAETGLIAGAQELFAQTPPKPASRFAPRPGAIAASPGAAMRTLARFPAVPAFSGSRALLPASLYGTDAADRGTAPTGSDPDAQAMPIAASQQVLPAAAMAAASGSSQGEGALDPERIGEQGFSPASPPPLALQRARADRWTLDSWAFVRAGSNAAPIAQTRVPVYGASQAGATLQFTIAPASGHAPRAYARAYRALIARGESELALGLSARPLPEVPVRVMAEMRATDGTFFSEIRPSAFAVTEIAPVALPLKLVGEVYAGAGYVGGVTDTGFVDGQASLAREVLRIGPAGPAAARLSLGGGVWGGAQRDAHRLDMGPSVRIDMALGKVPARLSIDWRERIAGDAAPESGLAATLSAGF
jgi:hypothetical protein